MPSRSCAWRRLLVTFLVAAAPPVFVTERPEPFPAATQDASPGAGGNLLAQEKKFEAASHDLTSDVEQAKLEASTEDLDADAERAKKAAKDAVARLVNGAGENQFEAATQDAANGTASGKLDLGLEETAPTEGPLRYLFMQPAERSVDHLVWDKDVDKLSRLGQKMVSVHKDFNEKDHEKHKEMVKKFFPWYSEEVNNEGVYTPHQSMQGWLQNREKREEHDGKNARLDAAIQHTFKDEWAQEVNRHGALVNVAKPMPKELDFSSLGESLHSMDENLTSWTGSIDELRHKGITAVVRAKAGASDMDKRVEGLNKAYDAMEAWHGMEKSDAAANQGAYLQRVEAAKRKNTGGLPLSTLAKQEGVADVDEASGASGASQGTTESSAERAIEDEVANEDA